jgi:hypothetical protein
MTGGDRGTTASGGQRGQTTIDFSVGIGIFLLALAFVFLFLPAMLGPFTSNDGDLLVLADRGADQLTAELLVEEVSRPTVLNKTCTVEFFDADGDTGNCRYDTDGSDPAAALGIGRLGAEVNVTVRRDAGSPRAIDGTVLAVGGTPDPNADVAVARRVVLLDGSQSRLVVRVW